jgi:hypothetical protein
MEVKSLAILTVATNKYIDYWAEMIQTADIALEESETEIVAYVLTDQTNTAERISSYLKKIKVIIYPIPAYGWPEATLFRYRLFDKISSDITEDLVMHLDADMLILNNFLPKLPNNFRNDIGLVRHPGFFRPRGKRLIAFYFSNLKYAKLDFIALIKDGGLGAWENSQSSHAFVKRGDRRNYVCGGTWFGLRSAFFKMVGELSQLEKKDTENGVVPKWHDESILNHWSSRHDATILSPSFCFYPQYPQLAGIEEYIRAVNKSE